MATSKKFLDENGLSTLWSQIENNFISSDNIEVIINAIDTVKADKESPEFTGIPTAPTASPKTNTTQIATTEFVNTAIDNALSKNITDTDKLEIINAVIAALPKYSGEVI